MTPSLEYAMTYWERIEGPLNPTRGSAMGEQVCWQIAEATLKGPGIDARLAMPGTDWMRVGPDGIRRPDFRAQMITGDGQTILFQYEVAIIKATSAFMAALNAGEPTAFEDQYMRMSPQFITGEGDYSWLEQNLFIGTGRLAGKKEIEYQLYRVL